MMTAAISNLTHHFFNPIGTCITTFVQSLSQWSCRNRKITIKCSVVIFRDTLIEYVRIEKIAMISYEKFMNFLHYFSKDMFFTTHFFSELVW